MKKKIYPALAAAMTAAALVSVPALPASADAGFTIQDGRLLDANGNDFVMRGVSHPHVWYTQEFQAFGDISSLGANAVRVVLGSGQRWGPSADVGAVVDECKAHDLICVLEVHDTTGYGEDGAAATLDQAVDYWISVQDQLVGEESYVLINIGNEPYGNNQQVNTNWAADTAAAINRLRDAGFDHTIVADAPNWGQDWQFIMRDQAADVFAADPHANTMFSIHMYGVFDTAAEVSSYLQTFVDNGLPIMVGEFGHDHSDGDPDEDAIMSTAEALGVGYIGWSWSGNSGGVEYLDMVNDFDVNSLTAWGQRIFHGADGIVATAECATVYDCEPPVDDTEPPSQPGQPTVTEVTATTAAVSWGGSTDNVGVAGYDVYVDGALETTTPSPSAALTGLTPATEYTVHVVARDAAGNESEPSLPTDFMTEESGGTGDCSVTFDASPWTSQPGQGGFTGYLELTNTGDAAIEGWTLEFDLPSGHGFTQGWSAVWDADGQAVTAGNVSWNRVIAPGESKDIGFNGSWTGSFTEPSAFTLNGTPCDI